VFTAKTTTGVSTEWTYV